MPKQRIYNMDILTGRIASVGYKIMVRPDGKRHVKDDVSSVMVAVDGRLSVSAESSIYDNRHKMYKRADMSTITIKSGDEVVFCGGTELLAKILTGQAPPQIIRDNVLD